MKIKKHFFMTKIITLSLLIMFLFTGCSIKFIEYSPRPSSSSSSPTSNLTIPSEINISSSLPDKPNSSTGSNSNSSSSKPPSTSSSSDKGFYTSDGISFNKTEEKTAYVSDDANIRNSAGKTPSISQPVKKGETITVVGESDNGLIMMIRYKGNTMFIDRSKMSYEFVAADSKPDSSSKSDSNNSSSTTNPGGTTPNPGGTTPNPGGNNSSSQSTSENNNPSPPGGIGYPSNPSSTSVNFGVTFANEYFTAEVLDYVTMNSGPNNPTNGNGYYVVDTFNSGTTLNCTGIGQNGFIRVELANGVIGFIDGGYLRRA